MADEADLVSVILPVLNGGRWNDTCLSALLRQTALQSVALELRAFDDGSSDDSWSLMQAWAPRLEHVGVRVVLGRSGAATGGGCGFAKNRAVAQSSGAWLCFQDVDDEMMPSRIEVQLEAARRRPGCLVGARARRDPEDSTPRFIVWANGTSAAQLLHHRFRECTLLMPTWFLARRDFEARL